MADEKKAKQKRTIKPVYAVMQVSQNGQVLDLTKEDVDIVGVYKSSDELLEVLDGEGLPKGSFYKRIALN